MLCGLLVPDQRQVTLSPLWTVTLLVEKKLSLTVTFFVAANACAARMPVTGIQTTARRTSRFRMGDGSFPLGSMGLDDLARRFLPPGVLRTPRTQVSRYRFRR